jgi:hypothetical protein
MLTGRSWQIWGLLLPVMVFSSFVFSQDVSTIEVRRVPIEKRWDHPVPTSVPEVPAVLNRAGLFYANEANHPLLSPTDRAYVPIREGGFRMDNGTRYFNRPLFYKGNMVGTGDRPMFLIARGYAKQWAGKLRFAVSQGDRRKWLDDFSSISTEFWPGRVEYRCEEPSLGVTVKLTVAAGLEGWSSIFSLDIEGPGASGAYVYWVFGDVVNEHGHTKDWIWWLPKRDFSWSPSNHAAEVSPDLYRISIDASDEDWKAVLSDMQLRSLQFYAGSTWKDQQLMLVDANAVGRAPRGLHPVAGGNLIACSAPVHPSWKGSMVVVWGGDADEKSLAKLDSAMRRLNLPWGNALYQEWYENYVGRGTQPEKTFGQIIAAPEKAQTQSSEFWKGIQQRVTFDIPDEELSAWANWLVASQEYLHWPLGQMDGFDTWGQGYNHIENMYSGWEYLGQHEQQEKWLRLFATSVRNGWIGIYQGTAPWRTDAEKANGGEEDQIAHYANYVYTHWLWTGDDGFVRDVWPYVKQLLNREIMQSDADGDGLFAARMSYWAPEDDSWGPKTGMESVQMMRALRGAAQLAKVAGDPEAERYYAEYAGKTEKALPQLWDESSGLLGWRDPLDVLHKSVSAPDVFFPILRQAVTPLQGYQMLRYVRENLWSEEYPGVARIWVDANLVAKQDDGPLPDIAWNTTSAAALVGDIDDFYPVLKTFAHATFYSAWPGAECSGVSGWGSGDGGMEDHNDGRMPALYFLGRGLFGLDPDIPHHRLTIEPHFPRLWKNASIHTPDVSYKYQQSENAIQIDVATPRPLAKTVKISVSRNVDDVTLNGKITSFNIEPSVNHALVVVDVPAGTKDAVVVRTSGPALRLDYSPKQALGVPFLGVIEGADAIEVVDPQKALQTTKVSSHDFEAAPARVGNRTAFVKVTKGKLSFYLPLDLSVGETFSIADPSVDVVRQTLSFRLENPGRRSGRLAARVRFGGAVYNVDVNLSGSSDTKVETDLNEDSVRSITPGSNPIEIGIEDRTYHLSFVDWTLPGANTQDWLGRVALMDLAWDYNEEAASLFNTKFYYDAWIEGIDYPVLPPATYEWAGQHIENPKFPSNRFLAAGKIPFYVASEKKLGGVYQSAEGGGPRNVLAVANWRPGLYPSNLVMPMQGMKLSKVYFLAYSWQRGRKEYHPNVDLVANYLDGSSQIRQLIPPYSFMPRYGLVSANHNPYRPEILDSGLQIGKEASTWYMTSAPDSSESADVYDLPLDPNRPLKSIEVRSVATESIFAIFGITLVKAQ